DAGLSREMHDPVEALSLEQLGHCRSVGEVELRELEVAVGLEQREARALQRGIVVLVQIVEPDDVVAPLEQALCGVKADEAGSARHQDLQCALPSVIRFPKSTVVRPPPSSAART